MSNPFTDQLVDKVLDMSRSELISTLLQTKSWMYTNIPETEYELEELQDKVYNYLLENSPC